jgi:hypothetical protein
VSESEERLQNSRVALEGKGVGTRDLPLCAIQQRDRVHKNGAKKGERERTGFSLCKMLRGGARQAADARINELKEVDDFPENKGLFSKTKVRLFSSPFPHFFAVRYS